MVSLIVQTARVAEDSWLICGYTSLYSPRGTYFVISNCFLEVSL